MISSRTILDPALMDDVVVRAAKYLAGLSERGVAPTEEAASALRNFADGAMASGLQQASVAAKQVLAELDEVGSPATIASAGPRFFGFVNGGTLPAPLAAHWMSTAWDQNSFSAASSPVGSVFEEIALAWLIDLLELPEGTEAAFTTGATLANFSALAAARHRLLERADWDVEADGLFGAPPIEVYVSEESHPTVRKGLGLLGLGRSRVTELATDAMGRIRADKLPRFATGSLVCAQAGNVNSGSFDPYPALVEACWEAGAWLHVDGAFGLWARASRAKRGLTEGIEGADSWATDAHKWLNVPYDNGIAFVKDADALRAAMSFSAAYLPGLPGSGPREPFHTTPEASRRPRGIDVWAALRSLGRDGVEALIDEGCAHASTFAAGLAAAGYEILNQDSLELNQVVVSFGDAETNHAVVEAVKQDGTCWCGPTEWRGRSAMRISISCWATTAADIERSIQAIVRCAERVGAHGGE